jgi:hypothetical protein
MSPPRARGRKEASEQQNLQDPSSSEHPAADEQDAADKLRLRDRCVCVWGGVMDKIVLCGVWI